MMYKADNFKELMEIYRKSRYRYDDNDINLLPPRVWVMKPIPPIQINYLIKKPRKCGKCGKIKRPTGFCGLYGPWGSPGPEYVDLYVDMNEFTLYPDENKIKAFTFFHCNDWECNHMSKKYWRTIYGQL
jgi:hypothetical protein